MTKFATESAMSPELLAKYEPVIGLEVHVQLATKTKIFCGCSTRFGDAPNSNVCPVCLGLPGTLPVLNKRAVEMAMRAALAIHCHRSRAFPLCPQELFLPRSAQGLPDLAIRIAAGHGRLARNRSPRRKKSASASPACIWKKTPANRSTTVFRTRMKKPTWDFNRCGTPLGEIVSEPDMRTPDEAYAYLTTLRQILLYHRRQRRKHGGRLTPLRRQCQRPPARRQRIWYQS